MPAPTRAPARSRHPDRFADRHIGPRERDAAEMLLALGVASVDDLIRRALPQSILLGRDLRLDDPLSESEAMEALGRMASRNAVLRSYIGLGYAGCVTPAVLRRNVLENPG